MWRNFFLIILLTIPTAISAGVEVPKSEFSRYLELPLDYDSPTDGSFRLYYEVNSDYNPDKPLVLEFIDPQQPFKTTADEQKKIMGLDVNLIYIQNRGFQKSFIPQLLTGTQIQWKKAFKILDSNNLIRDAEMVRRDYIRTFKPRDRRFFIVGASGGGMLACQYLAKFPENVDKAIFGYSTFDNTGCCVWNKINFQSRLRAFDENLLYSLDKILKEPQKYSIHKESLCFMIQRLGYEFTHYEPKVSELVQDIVSRKFQKYDESLKEVSKLKLLFDLSFENKEMLDLVQKLFSATDHRDAFKQIVSCHLPAMVRIAEFLSPLDFNRKDRIAYDADIEIDGFCYVFLPRIAAFLNEGEIRPRYINCFRQLDQSRVKADILLVGGYFDHTVPYQELMRFGALFPESRVALLNDGHSLPENKEFYRRLTKYFFETSRGISDPDLLRFFQQVKPEDISLSLANAKRDGTLDEKLLGYLTEFLRKIPAEKELSIDDLSSCPDLRQRKILEDVFRRLEKRMIFADFLDGRIHLPDAKSVLNN